MITGIHENEAAYFRTLGRLIYNEPHREVIQMISRDGFFTELPYAQANDLARKGQAQINRWLDSGSVYLLTGQAREDYMRLLVGVGKVLAPPWSSVYLDEDRVLFNRVTLNVRQFYSRHGRAVKQKYKEPDDHIGLELEFLASLLEAEDMPTAQNFCRTHITSWIFQWNNDVQKYANTGYYQGIAHMAAGGVQYLGE